MRHEQWSGPCAEFVICGVTGAGGTFSFPPCLSLSLRPPLFSLFLSSFLLSHSLWLRICLSLSGFLSPPLSLFQSSFLVVSLSLAPYLSVCLFLSLCIHQSIQFSFLIAGVFATVTQVVRTEGALGLYKGNGAQMIRIFPYAAIQFTSYEIYKQVTCMCVQSCLCAMCMQ